MEMTLDLDKLAELLVPKMRKFFTTKRDLREEIDAVLRPELNTYGQFPEEVLIHDISVLQNKVADKNIRTLIERKGKYYVVVYLASRNGSDLVIVDGRVLPPRRCFHLVELELPEHDKIMLDFDHDCYSEHIAESGDSDPYYTCYFDKTGIFLAGGDTDKYRYPVDMIEEKYDIMIAQCNDFSYIKNYSAKA